MCIVLIKNAEHICQEMDKSLPYDNQISAEFRYILDNNIYQDGVIIVAATSNVYLINPTFRRAGRLEIEVITMFFIMCKMLGKFLIRLGGTHSFVYH